MKTYKKVLNIKYQQKVFTIFVDNDGRKVFLELRNNNYYYYPTLEDFTFLTKIYNDKSLVVNELKFSFDERIRVGALSLALVSVLNLVGCGRVKVEVKNNEVIETIEPLNLDNPNVIDAKDEEKILDEDDSYVKTIYIKDIKELDDILDYQFVDKDTIIKTINEKDLPDKVKEAAVLALDNMLNRVPDIDLRIFYENLKDLTYEEVPLKELQKEQNIEASFSPVERRITTHSNVTLKTLCHEMNHMFYSFYLQKGLTFYIRHESLGVSLIEAMTEEETIDKIEDGVYKEERYVLDVLLSLIDFNESDYHNLGVWHLIRFLQDRYPEVDVEQMIYILDCREISRLNIESIEILDSPINIMDDLFEMIKLRVQESPEASYQLFSKFATSVLNTCSEEDMLKYLEDYNNFLQENNIDIISTDTFIKYNSLLYNDFLVVKGNYPILISKEIHSIKDDKVIINYTSIDELGEEIPGSVTVNNYNDYKIKSFYIENAWEYVFNHASEIKNNNFVKSLAKEFVSPHLYKTIPIKMNNTMITQDYVDDLSVKIGLTNDGNIGFMLYKDDKLLYTTSDLISKTTNSVPLNYYLPFDIDNLDTLNLADYFNEEYLKNKAGKYSHWFTNLKIEDNQYTITPDYKIIITDLDDEAYQVDIRWCFFRLEEETVLDPYDNQLYSASVYYGVLPIDYLIVDGTNIDGKDLQLEEILESEGLLNPNQLEYYFTKEQYENLFLTYIYERESNLIR